MPDRVLRSNVPRGVFDGFLALLSAGDACAYPFVFQRFSEPIGVIPTVTEQPIYLWQAADKRPCTDVVTDLSSGHEQVQRASLAVADGVKLGIHTALGSPDQASTPPFLTPKLVAVR